MMEVGSLVTGLGSVIAGKGFASRTKCQRPKTQGLYPQLLPQPQLQAVHFSVVGFVIVARQV